MPMRSPRVPAATVPSSIAAPFKAVIAPKTRTR